MFKKKDKKICLNYFLKQNLILTHVFLATD